MTLRNLLWPALVLFSACASPATRVPSDSTRTTVLETGSGDSERRASSMDHPVSSAQPTHSSLRTSAPQTPIALERPIKTFDSPAAPATAAEHTFTEPLVPRSETRGIVLMYHSIDKQRSLRTVWPWDFEEHIKRLRQNHIEIIAMSQLVDFLYGDIQQLPARVAVLTIDDGEVLFHKYAWPILKKHRAPFALGIITKPTLVAEHAKALNWDQLNEMLASGLCEIASHSHKHLAMTTLFGPALDRELNHSRALITEHTGYVPQAFIYPLGAFDRRVIEHVRNARYRAAFTAVGYPVKATSSPYRINRFKMQRTTSYNALTRFFERGEPTR